MHPILAVLLTGLLVTAAYSTGKDISESQRYTAAAANTTVDNTANSQCPKPEPHQVYDAALPVKPGQNVVKINGRFTYIENLYGKKCSGPLIKNGTCTDHNFCDGTKAQCQLDLFGKNQGECKLNEQGEKIRVVSNGTGVTNDGESPYAGIFRQAQQQQAPPPEINKGTVNTQDTQAIKNVYGDASSQNGSQAIKQPTQQTPVVAPARNETLANQFVQGNNPQGATQALAQQPLNANINPNTVKTAPPPVNQPVTNTPTKLATAQTNNPPTAQNTFQSPTQKLATAQTPQSAVTSAGANPGSGSTIKTAAGATTGTGAAPSGGASGVKTGTGATPGSGASGSGTPAPAAKPNLSTSIRNAFQGGLNATQIVNGVVNLVSTVISGGSRSSTQSVAQAVDNGARAANTQASNRVASPIIVEGGVGSQTTPPGQSREASAPVSSFIIPGNAPVVLSSGIEVAELLSLSGESFSFPDDVTDPSAPASNTETSSGQGIADLLNTPAASNEIPGPRIVNAQTPGGAITIMRAGEQFVLNPNLAPENQVISQNSFAPLPQPERSRSVVQVFHTVSIPNILETISRGSVDFILQLLKRDSPKDTIVYTEWEQDSVVPVPSNAAPLLPDATRTNTTTIGGQVTQTAPGQGGDARNIERVVYEERLREAPVAVFAETSAAHSGSAHVPMVNRAFVFDSLLPVPEVAIDIEQPATEPGPIGTVLRVLFPWFFGEMR